MIEQKAVRITKSGALLPAAAVIGIKEAMWPITYPATGLYMVGFAKSRETFTKDHLFRDGITYLDTLGYGNLPGDNVGCVDYHVVHISCG